MRTKLTIICLLLLSVATSKSQSQHTSIKDSSATTRPHFNLEVTTTTTTTTTREEKKSPNKWCPDMAKYQGFHLNYNGLISGLNSMSLPSDARYLDQTTKSIGVELNFGNLILYSSGCFGVVSGMGLESNNFRFSNNITLGKDAQGRIIPIDYGEEYGVELSKSKLTTTYLNIPLLFQFNLSRARHNRGWISFGAVCGMKLQSYTKVKSCERGIEKNFNDQNISNFHLGFQVMVGYGHMGFMAKYYPQSIFKKDMGPNVQQVNVGLVFLLND